VLGGVGREFGGAEDHVVRPRALLEDSAQVGSDGPNVLGTAGWGEPIYPDTVTSLMIKLVCANQQLPHARLHDLRHLHATTLLLSGVPVHVVAARLGHADPAITLRVYAHVIRSAETAAADIFAQAVKAA
jgi:integrase